VRRSCVCMQHVFTLVGRCKHTAMCEGRLCVMKGKLKDLGVILLLPFCVILSLSPNVSGHCKLVLRYFSCVKDCSLAPMIDQ
jgi:hypothetical protein